MKHHIHFPKSEGKSSAQAHCDLPEGTYYYVLQLKTKNGKTHVIKNFVELIR